MLIALLLIDFPSSEEPTQTVGYSITSAVIMTRLFNIWTIHWQLWFPFPSPFLQQTLVEKSHAGLLFPDLSSIASRQFITHPSSNFIH